MHSSLHIPETLPTIGCDRLRKTRDLIENETLVTRNFAIVQYQPAEFIDLNP